VDDLIKLVECANKMGGPQRYGELVDVVLSKQQDKRQKEHEQWKKEIEEARRQRELEVAFIVEMAASTGMSVESFISRPELMGPPSNVSGFLTHVPGRSRSGTASLQVCVCPLQVQAVPLLLPQARAVRHRSHHRPAALQLPQARAVRYHQRNHH
jgi:hypothetical protein